MMKLPIPSITTSQSSTCLTMNSIRSLHSSIRATRGISIGGGNSGTSIPPSSSIGGTPFSALRAELNQKNQNEVKVETSTQARLTNMSQESKTKKSSVQPRSPPTTSAQPRAQNVQQEKESVQINESPKAESWSTVSEQIRLGQIEEQKREKQAKSALKKGLGKGEPETISSSSSQAQRVYQFSNSIEAQMFITGATSALSSYNPNWQGSIGLHRSRQGIESVEVRLSEEGEILQVMDSMAKKLHSSSSNFGQRNSQAFQSGTISHADVTESAMLNTRSRSGSKYKIDEHVPVTIQSKQVPGIEENSIDQKVSYTSQGPVGHVLGTNESSPNNPIENHFPIPNLHFQSKREFATLMGIRNDNLNGGSLSTKAMKNRKEFKSISNLIFSSSQQRSLFTSQWNMQNSQKNWSNILSNEVNDRIRLDDFFPVVIQSTQLGQKRVVLGRKK